MLSSRLVRIGAVAAAVLALGASGAEAHVGLVQGFSPAEGFLHPLTGFDHVLAMVAVGIWAAQIGGRALYLIPAAFVGAMVVGAALSLGGFALPAVEIVIAASLVALGSLVALRLRMPVIAGMAMVALFAIFHGHAHGSEAPAAALPGYFAGFVAATVLLHGLGIAGARAAQHLLPLRTVQAAGGAIMIAGLALLVA